MSKILATIKKEWLLLRYDISGLLLLLIMPALLIIIMALVQDAPFKDYQEYKIDLLIVDEDGGALAKEIKHGLKQSHTFSLIEHYKGEALTQATMQHLLAKGTYRVGLVIPKSGTAEMVNTANQLANYISDMMQAGGHLNTRESRPEVKIKIFYDPVVKPTFKLSVGLGIDRLVAAASSRLMIDRIAKMKNLQGVTSHDTLPTSAIDEELLGKLLHGIGMKEETLSNKHQNNVVVMNSVQHNVPAWALFGMFFIIVPIVGNMLREKEEGSALRIALIPRVARHVALGRIFFYMLVCLAQFMLMLLIGIYVMPLLGLPSLHSGNHFFALVVIVLSVAYAATAFAHLIGNFFTTTNQALPFAAISIVILSAISGIWIPMEVLSSSLQTLGYISPMYWGLRGINTLFLRNGNISHIAQEVLILWCFGTVFWLISTYKRSKQAI